MAETWICLEELESLVGKVEAQTLCRFNGGVPFRMPVKADPKHRLAGLVGFFGMSALCELYGGQMVTVPTCKNADPQKPRIIAALQAGKSHAAIARETGVTERYVREVAAAIRLPNRHLTLPFI